MHPPSPRPRPRRALSIAISLAAVLALPGCTTQSPDAGAAGAAGANASEVAPADPSAAEAARVERSAPAPEPAVPSPAATVAADDERTPVDVQPAETPQNPLLDAEPVAVGFDGTVAEHLPAGSYSYHRIATADRADVWIATLGEGIATIGAEVAVTPFARKTAFHSRHLDRTFDSLLFAAVAPR